MREMLRPALIACAGLLVGTATMFAYAEPYEFHVLLRHGGAFWLSLGPDSPRLSPAMRLALADARAAQAGAFEWRSIGQGFDVADLPALIGGAVVDRIMLARIDPARFRFSVRNAPKGDKDLDQWMGELNAALVVNGSYYSHLGTPDTPVLSEGHRLGPKDYDAKAGAFVASAAFTGIRDLEELDWRTALQGADNAMVSFPLLLADGKSRPTHEPVAREPQLHRSGRRRPHHHRHDCRRLLLARSPGAFPSRGPARPGACAQSRWRPGRLPRHLAQRLYAKNLWPLRSAGRGRAGATSDLALWNHRHAGGAGDFSQMRPVQAAYHPAT